MTNWATTFYKCIGDSKEIDELENLIHQNKSGWISDLLILMGMDLNVLDKKGLGYKGHINSIDFDSNGNLIIYQETAWCEQKGFRKSIETRFPSIKVFFTDEEPGMEVYTTNDPDGRAFEEQYVLDGPYYEYFENLEQAISTLQHEYGMSILEKSVEAIQESLNKYNQTVSPSHWLNFHKFQYIED